MRFTTDANSLEKFRKRIKDRFAEFNRHSVASHSRRYPTELRELIFQGHQAGLRPRELMKLSGMSSTAVSYATKNYQSATPVLNKVKPKNPASRRLEVVSEAALPVELGSLLVIRLPSGVILELKDGSALTPSLLDALANVEIHNVTSC